MDAGGDRTTPGHCGVSAPLSIGGLPPLHCRFFPPLPPRMPPLASTTMDGACCDGPVERVTCSTTSCTDRPSLRRCSSERPACSAALPASCAGANDDRRSLFAAHRPSHRRASSAAGVSPATTLASALCRRVLSGKTPPAISSRRACPTRQSGASLRRNNGDFGRSSSRTLSRNPTEPKIGRYR